MFAVLEIVMIALGAALAVPVLTLCVEIFASLKRIADPATAAQKGPRARLAVLVPAHNEEAALARNLDSILRQLRAGDRLVVVADNCSDGTARVARERGAEVTVRSAPALRGKGYALDHGLAFLAQTGAPEIVVCVDADCELGAGCLDRLARACLETRAPTQAAYLMRPAAPATHLASIVAFAWRVKNYVRPLGLRRMGLPCQLAGSGMAFCWHDIRSADVKTANLVEDLSLGLDLALNGKFPRFCPEAIVLSDVAAGGVPSYAQRARWEHGAIATAMRYAPRLMRTFGTARNLSLMAMMLDLAVPPAALLTLLLVGHFAAAALLYVHGTGARAAPLWLATINGALFLLATCAAWWRFGRDVVPLRVLAFVPLYVLGKLPLYLRLFANRQTEWVRGKRRLSA